MMSKQCIGAASKESMCLTTCHVKTAQHRDAHQAKYATAVQVAVCVTHFADFIVPAPS
jgi:hypothetical protein